MRRLVRVIPEGALFVNAAADEVGVRFRRVGAVPGAVVSNPGRVEVDTTGVGGVTGGRSRLAVGRPEGKP